MEQAGGRGGTVGEHRATLGMNVTWRQINTSPYVTLAEWAPS